MTRPVRSRILKDVNGDISDHLRNHIHLTNCIHLKNHMHKHSPILSDRSMMRDLIALQRSRSLRDPSASPHSWRSSSVVELLPRKGEMEGSNIIQEGRRSVGAERPRQGTRLSRNSPPFSVLGSSQVAPREDDGMAMAAAISEHGEESTHGNLSGKSDSRVGKIKQKEKQDQDPQFKTLLGQLNRVGLDSGDVVSSNFRPKDMFLQSDRIAQEAGDRNYGDGVNRGRRRRFRASRRPRPLVASRDLGVKSELSVASNSLGQGPMHRIEHMGDEEEVAEVEEEREYQERKNVTRAPSNGCGIPWNWSRIHHRGRTFLDKAGKSLSCGLSERRRDGSDLPVASDSFNESSKSEAEALPLLYGSQGSSEKLREFSGELGIFADHLMKHDQESDPASEARFSGVNRPRTQRNRHQNLTQKYVPRSFRDLMGQNLVAQALSNAVVQRRIGLLYVFYGPHGTGKTSCARVFARALNCQSSEDPKPCGYCNSCVAHDSGKSRNVREVGPVSNFEFENFMDLLDDMVVSHIPARSQYRVFIFDDCDTLSSDCWGVISKIVDRAPRRVVLILVCSSLEVLPHIIISRCQKFSFPKLKDADIIYTLQWVSSKERIEVDKEAMKLIASRSDGSSRDALMTLDQLSLLGQRISVTLVQELVGLISDEKLVDLLDLALSADTVSTVKNLRVIMETGVEPLALMSQLATVVTDILAGTYDFTKERNRRKFLRHLPLSKEEMERLRQALRTLSEAEKQLRMSNDKTTWLTAALLQLAPDQQYMMPHSSADNSFKHSPSIIDNVGVQESNRRNPGHVVVADNGRGWPLNDRTESIHPRSSSRLPGNGTGKGRFDSRGNAGVRRPLPGIANKRIDDIWLEVIDKVPVDSVKEFLFQEGRLISISFGAAPTVQLLFSSHLTKTKAEKFREHILQAFETVLGSIVTMEIRCESKGATRIGSQTPLPLPGPRDATSQLRRSEIVEVEPSPRDPKGNVADKRAMGEESSHMEEPPFFAERRNVRDKTPSQSIVRGKVSLAHVIQQAGEGHSQRNSWSKRMGLSIAEKLEQENLRLEPRSRSLLCWKASRATRQKLSRLKIRARRPRSLLKLVSCGKCLSSKSPRS